ELRRLAIEMAGVLKRVEIARAELLAATVARKAMETLRDKALAEWNREQAQREAAELDDLTLMRHGRGSADGLGRSTHDEEAAV
nr:flagellar FliJ family protein [Phycisphaerales bacterium]